MARPARQMMKLQGEIADFDISPDGKRFAIARGRPMGDIVMLTDLQ
jgi:hypothetical protein